MNKRKLLPIAHCLLPLLALGMPLANAGGGFQANPGGWLADASKAPLPTKKIAGTLNGSPLTVKRVVWKRQMALDFSDAPLDIMALEIGGTTKKPHGLGIPMDTVLKDFPPEARAKYLKAAKAASPNALTFVITIALRKGASVEGKEFLHRPKDSIGVPEQATVAKPVLVGVDAQLSETDSVSIGYTLRLKFGPKRGSVQPGAIYLCLEDTKKSLLVGTFEAIIK